MKKLFILFAAVGFFNSCKDKREIQEYEPVFDNYAKVVRITEVSRDFITVKNNTGVPADLREYKYSNGDTTARVAGKSTVIQHQASYTFTTAMPLDFTRDTISLFKNDFATLQDTLADQFFPVGVNGF